MKGWFLLRREEERGKGVQLALAEKGTEAEFERY